MFWNKKKDELTCKYSFDGYVGSKPSYEELEKKMGELEQKLEAAEREKEKAELDKQLAEMRGFAKPGDTFSHAGIDYICIKVDCFSDISFEYSTPGRHVTWDSKNPFIKAQRIDSRDVHAPVRFKYSELECLKAQNRD